MDRYRHEYKYVIDACQRSILLMKVMPVMKPDPYAVQDGSYLVRSLYFDDISDSCLRSNLDGSDPRAKFRLRYYNDDPDRVRLEKKIKRRGMTLKQSCLLTGDEAKSLTGGTIPPATGEMPVIKRQLLTEMRLLGLAPKVTVTYLRVPFVYPAGNMRVTFDGQITSSDETGRFLTGRYREFPVMPSGQSVLEVKWDEVLPLHIKSLLELDTLRWSAFSKYCSCRQNCFSEVNHR